MTMENFKVSKVRTVSSPSSDNITTYFIWVNFKDLPSEIPLDVNPRKPKMNTSVARQLIAAVKSPDNIDFDINNRGIVITAKKVKFDTSTSNVSLDLGDDKKRYGILDGGHTYRAIIDNRNKVPKDINKYVRLEVIVGSNLDAASLADARNTSVQVSDIALFELDDKFDFIKNSIKGEKYANKIAYKDNDDKEIPIANLLKLMFAFNINRYPDDSNAPVPAYSGKAAVFKDYKSNYFKNENIYKQLALQLPTLINLYECIERDLPHLYQEFKKDDGKKSKFGLVRGIEGSGNFTTEFNKIPINYNISIGFLLPIFGSFRALLKKNTNNTLKWEFDPIKVWEKSGKKLVQNTFDTDTNPQQAGKSKTLWQANYRIVDSIRKDFLLKQLENN